MKTVFISYSRDDLDIVENEIVSEIERINGVTCWLDIHDIEAGAESFPNVIKQGLEDCFIFLIMLSKSSMQKEWPHTELKDAEKLKAEDPSRKIAFWSLIKKTIPIFMTIFACYLRNMTKIVSFSKLQMMTLHT